MSETLSTSEAAYFDSRGEADPASHIEPAETHAPAEASSEPAEKPAEAEPTAEAPKPATVPPETHPAVVAERERRKAAEKQLREFETSRAADMARMEERLRALQEAAQPKPVQTEPVEFARDPERWIRENIGATRDEIAQLRQWQQQQQAAAQRQHHINDLQMWGRSQETAYTQTVPDYHKAADFLRSSRDQELAALGVTDPAQRQSQIAQDVYAMSIAARQANSNVAESIYALAKLRGYAPPAAAPAVPAIDAKAPAAAPELGKIQRGQQLASGLRSAGSAPSPKLTAQALADMSPEEFAKVSGSREVRELMGG